VSRMTLDSLIGTPSAGFRLSFIDPSLLERLGEATALEIGKAFASGALEIEGDLEAAYRSVRSWLMTRGARSPGAAAPDSAETASRLPGTRQERVNFHYDLPLGFWKPWLGESLLYTCAYYETPEDELTRAQYQKVDRILDKLRLTPEDRLLDIGCGWGALSVRAATRYGAKAVGITLSELQADHARRAVKEAGAEDRCTILVQDYREFDQQQFDKVAAVGVSEHLGSELPAFFAHVERLLKPDGLFLNQGIVHAEAAEFMGGREFIEEFIFPGALLRTIGEVVAGAEQAGFEVLDVESLSQHYVLTLREWLRRFEAHEVELRGFVDQRRYRELRVYLAAFACEFSLERLRVYQTLCRKSLPEPGRAPRWLKRI